MAAEKPARRLGRGLDALLRGSSNKASARLQSDPGFHSLKISSIRNNPYQPRKKFSTGELAELEQSIRANGLLQPITVRKSPRGEGYEIIAGERRLRAVSQLGWSEVPALVRDVDDQALLSFALIENLQRSDLDPIEEAEGYNQLISEFQLTQQAVAELVGKDRTTISNALRVLNLPIVVREMVREGKLTVGHAKALLGIDKADQLVAFAREVVARGLTVRDVERRAKGAATKGGKNRSAAKRSPAGVHALEAKIRRRLQTDVELSTKANGSGTLGIRFYSSEDLERIIELMGITHE